MPFKPGNVANPKGGKIGNKGGGRPSNALIELCKGIVDRKKLIERLGKIAAGEEVTPAMGPFGPLKDKHGKQIYAVAPIKAQIDAISELLDRGYGKAVQQVESSSFDEAIELMRKRYA